jgi:hypothetical protein
VRSVTWAPVGGSGGKGVVEEGGGGGGDGTGDGAGDDWGDPDEFFPSPAQLSQLKVAPDDHAVCVTSGVVGLYKFNPVDP